MKGLSDKQNINTRFVIIEKYIGQRYNTPLFDFDGNRYDLSTSAQWIGRNIFVAPGIHTYEIDISTVELILYDVVSKPVFELEFMNKPLPL